MPIIHRPLRSPSLIQNFRIIKLPLSGVSIRVSFAYKFGGIFASTYVMQPSVQAVLLKNLGNVYFINTLCGWQSQALFTLSLFLTSTKTRPRSDHAKFNWEGRCFRVIRRRKLQIGDMYFSALWNSGKILN